MCYLRTSSRSLPPLLSDYRPPPRLPVLTPQDGSSPSKSRRRRNTRRDLHRHLTLRFRADQQAYRERGWGKAHQVGRLARLGQHRYRSRRERVVWRGRGARKAEVERAAAMASVLAPVRVQGSQGEGPSHLSTGALRGSWRSDRNPSRVS
jgi:hypothetical protein